MSDMFDVTIIFVAVIIGLSAASVSTGRESVARTILCLGVVIMCCRAGFDAFVRIFS